MFLGFFNNSLRFIKTIGHFTNRCAPVILPVNIYLLSTSPRHQGKQVEDDQKGLNHRPLSVRAGSHERPPWHIAPLVFEGRQAYHIARVGYGGSHMSEWPRHVAACKSCTGEPTQYAYGARDYCSRCYRLIRHIEHARAWNTSRRETLKKLPKDGMFNPAVGYSKSTRLMVDSWTPEQFEICRTETIRQLENRLTKLKYREQIRRHEMPVDALSLEEKFGELLRIIRRKAEYPRNASYLAQHFNEGERRIIYALLEEIIEQAPWKGIEWHQIFERIYPTGK